MTAPDLAYVALVVDEPEASAAIFERDFGLPRKDFDCGSFNVPAISVGRSALALFQPDNPFLGPDAKKGVHHIAIAAADPETAGSEVSLGTPSPKTLEILGLSKKFQEMSRIFPGREPQ